MDARLLEIRSQLRSQSNKDHAAFHKAYHKSSKKFYGLRSKQMTDVFHSVFPKNENLPKEDAKKIAADLWASEWFEEQVIGLLLLERYAKKLTPGDLPYLKKIVGECEGWATLDWIATKMLGMLALNYPDIIYPKVRAWTKSKHLWTRRAAILIHITPARKKQLHTEYALPTFRELLHEKEFFIRKAIGWTLREISKQYPEITMEFLKEHKTDASGLTFREGMRRLPERMKKELARA